MAIGARCLGDNLGTEAIHSCQWKTKKMQQTGIRPMAIGTQQTDSSLRAEANHYIRGARRMSESLKNASAQWTDSGLMVFLQ